MGFWLKRSVLRKLAEAKLNDSVLLLEHKRYSNAYYLAGYAIELGLKACIAVQIVAETIPDKNFVNAIYNHDLSKLVSTAGMAGELERKKDQDKEFAANWAIVTKWSPEKRYESVDPMSAQLFFDALCDKESGVFEWIKAYW